MRPDTARSALVAVLDDELDARWQAAIRAPDDRAARRSFETCHELRALLAALPDEDEAVLALGVLAASGDVLGVETFGQVATYGRHGSGDPGAFLSTLIERAAARAAEVGLAKLG